MLATAAIRGKTRGADLMEDLALPDLISMVAHLVLASQQFYESRAGTMGHTSMGLFGSA